MNEVDLNPIPPVITDDPYTKLKPGATGTVTLRVIIPGVETAVVESKPVACEVCGKAEFGTRIGQLLIIRTTDGIWHHYHNGCHAVRTPFPAEAIEAE